jgi:type 1 glutamine amidotransferase
MNPYRVSTFVDSCITQLQNTKLSGEPKMNRTWKRPTSWLLAGLLVTACWSDRAVNAGENEEGFKPIFNGKTLEGWDGDRKFWRVEDGTITGQTTKDNPTPGNTFLIWRGGEPADFELKLQYRIVANNDKGFGNSGIQYRSFEVKNKKWVVGGYQADFEAGDTYSGILYGERFRGILAKRGDKTVLTRSDDGKFQVTTVGKVGDTKEIQAKIKKEDWNDYHVIANGFHFVHKINGVLTAECTDNDKKQRRASGILALQLHAGEPMTVQFRNIRLKTLKPAKKSAAIRIKLNGKRFGSVRIELKDGITVGVRLASVTVDVNTANGVQVAVARANLGLSTKARKVVLIAGRKSHGYGAHEHRAGCMLLAKALNASGLPIQASVVTEGWPKDATVLNDADAIVIYADGGGGHPFNKHLDEVGRLMKKGVGLVCIHYGVEVPKGKSGDAFLGWTGGYFEPHWSVNPHWTANYRQLGKHPTTNGVQPFSIYDEWYYHMRFRTPPRPATLKGGAKDAVIAILTDLPPASTLVKADGSLARPDNAHNNNPFVRKAVLEEKQPQHTAWARERPDGGRGFGFTGGHNHWNWGHNQFRKLMLNAIAWTAHVDVPKGGVPSKPLTVEELLANQDYSVPNNFNPARIQAMLDQWNRKSASKN